MPSETDMRNEKMETEREVGVLLQRSVQTREREGREEPLPLPVSLQPVKASDYWADRNLSTDGHMERATERQMWERCTYTRGCSSLYSRHMEPTHTYTYLYEHL